MLTPRPRRVPMVLVVSIAVVAALDLALSRQEAAGGVAPVPPLSATTQSAIEQVSLDRLQRDVTTLVGFGTRHVLSETDSETRGVGAARRYLKAELEKAAARSEGRMTVQETAFDRTFGRREKRTGHFVNTIAHLRGSDPSRGAWVFGGHYDSRNSKGMDGKGDAPGADDDASGTAVILEMARILATLKPAADVYLCAFDGEELGLFGSDHFAAQLHEQGVQVEGMITNDIVGSSTAPDGSRHPNTLRCFSEGFPPRAQVNRRFRNMAAETEGPCRQLARYAALLGDRYQPQFRVKLIHRPDRFGRGGDHQSFTKRGDPGIRFTEAVEDYRHQHENVRVEDGVQYGDLVEFVDFEYLTRVARLNVALAVNGASAPPPPARVRLRDAVSHHTTITWTEVKSPQMAGYRVWRRPTDGSRWQEFRPVPKGTHELVFENVSIDDWHFAVSTVDAAGHVFVAKAQTKRRPAPASPADTQVTTATRRLSCRVTVRPITTNTQNQILNGSTANSGEGLPVATSRPSDVSTSVVL